MMKFIFKKSHGFILLIVGTMILSHNCIAMNPNMEEGFEMSTPRGGITQRVEEVVVTKKTQSEIEKRRFERIEGLRAKRLSQRQEKVKLRESQRIEEESKKPAQEKTE